MKFNLTKLLVIFFCLVLVSCSPAITTKKVIKNAKPIQTLDIIIFMGDLTLTGLSTDTVNKYQNNIKDALTEHLPKIFAKNNIPVLTIFVDSGKPEGVALKQALNILNNPKSSHSLTMNARYLRNKTIVWFDAELRDNSTKEVVWTAEKVQMSTSGNWTPLREVNSFAWGLLKGLERNSLISFVNGSPVDEDGKPF